MRDVILTVGNNMMGDDGAGPLLAQLLQKQAAPGWDVVDGGSMPEDAVHWIRSSQVGRLLIVDAAEMGLDAGAIRRIETHQIADPFLLSTHTLPLSYLVDSLRSHCEQIHFIGIQPELVAFGYPMHASVRHAVETLHAQLCAGLDPATIEVLQGVTS